MSLDMRLGGRMLLKYPGRTFAGGLALAIEIGIGAGWYNLSSGFRVSIRTRRSPSGIGIVGARSLPNREGCMEGRRRQDRLALSRGIRRLDGDYPGAITCAATETTQVASSSACSACSRVYSSVGIKSMAP